MTRGTKIVVSIKDANYLTLRLGTILNFRESNVITRVLISERVQYQY